MLKFLLDLENVNFFWTYKIKKKVELRKCSSQKIKNNFLDLENENNIFGHTIFQKIEKNGGLTKF